MGANARTARLRPIAVAAGIALVGAIALGSYVIAGPRSEDRASDTVVADQEQDNAGALDCGGGRRIGFTADFVPGDQPSRRSDRDALLAELKRNYPRAAERSAEFVERSSDQPNRRVFEFREDGAVRARFVTESANGFAVVAEGEICETTAKDFSR